MDERIVLRDIAERVIDEQVYPYLVERIDRSIGLSPGDLATLGLAGWDRSRLARTIADALLEDTSRYGRLFRTEVGSLAYDPYEPLDPSAIDSVLARAYPPNRLTASAVACVARIMGDTPDGPALINATGHAMSRVEHTFRRV